MQDEAPDDSARKGQDGSSEELDYNIAEELTHDVGTPNNGIQDNLTEETRGSVMPEQKRGDEANQSTINVLKKNRQVQKTRKRKHLTTQILGSDVQDAMKHLDYVVSKMTKTTDENYQFGQHVASQLRSLPPAWSVMLRTEIQNAVSEVIFQTLFSHAAWN